MIHIKTEEEIQIMKEAGKILASLLDELKKAVQPGVATKQLEELAVQIFKEKRNKYPEAKIKPSFLNYHGYPASICVSINDEVVHGLPSRRVIKDGDLVSIDAGLFFNGYHADSAFSIIAGKTDNEVAIKLIEITKTSLKKGIEQAKVGKKIGDIGFAIETYVQENGFSVVRELVGHGIGKELHEEPQVLNFGLKGSGEELEAGMVLAIEPMVSSGGWRIILGDDGFTYKTKDGSLSAHFEHTVAITKNGPLILTS